MSKTGPYPPLKPSPSSWLAAVRADFDTFLKDHASCEKKASGMALNVASHYPDRPQLLQGMAELAVEELTHYRQVVRLLVERGLAPAADAKDPYIHALQSHIRRGSDRYLLDRLLVGAVVERRGHERFALIADALTSEDAELAGFYRGIAESERRHWLGFVEHARRECAEHDVDRRLAELFEVEADIMLAQAPRPALH